MTGSVPAFASDLISRLRRRGLPLGVDDLVTLRAALAAGHGLGSTEALSALCVTLWATSRRDAEIIRSTLLLVGLPEWSMATVGIEVGDVPTPLPASAPPLSHAEPVLGSQPAAVGVDDEDLSIAQPSLRVGGVEPPRSGQSAPFLIMSPQYPVSEREVAEAWRRLRRPTRHGPRVELDVQATVNRYAATGVVTGPVLMPRRVNAARLLLLIDRHGSMTPFHNFVDHVTRSIVRAARLDSITVRYFRNSPGNSPDRSVLTELIDPVSVELDAIVDRIPPLTAGWVYDDPALTRRRPLRRVLEGLAPGSGVVVVSDAGAQRGSLVVTRIFDAVALGLAVTAQNARIAWLNPLSTDRWIDATAEQIARHISMYPLDRAGMYAAVDVLRGRPAMVKAPL
ncbi:VWA domain-containing protein [Actinoplanes derwentensis]|uniref:VWA domain containing CoxE-like protein n=1 Tax=Actinoplanes derwentensis TaxID=113562 RepID=A0A1H1XVX3_9ACTN|nr:VWA domain-containing protein [Actinoplanes derwentensis]GID90291.1 hypothetical protein Ade03nite_92150 [Actinoplanes derwentensis]SDT13420.1 hypothetical protein SAMN04489716_2611 [Actinoplanes derwentensis]